MRQLAEIDFDCCRSRICLHGLWRCAPPARSRPVPWSSPARNRLRCRAPSRVSRCTVLRSPPITPVAGETSLATIQSQPLRASFALALSIRCSVSAAKPITSGGRLSFSFEIVARMSGFSTSCSGGMPAEVFFSFCSPSLATRQSATAAAKIAISAGSAASHLLQHVARGFHVLHGHARRDRADRPGR